ncbi:MAG: hypothetical protein WBG63_04880 [Phormidesmis sp.]
MPRLIVLLLTVASLTALTLQNLSSENEVPLVLVGQTVSESIPLGWLLLSAVGIGALLTLFLYGLVGLRRPPESKYQPMGRRVPYPNSPDGSLPTSSSLGEGGTSTPSGGYTASSYGRSSAFVSEPPISPPASAPASSPSPEDKPFITPPQDTSPSASSPPYPSTYASPDNFAASEPRSRPSSFVQQPIDGIKSALGIKAGFGAGFGGLGKKKDRRPADQPPAQSIGEDWGELRTTEQRNRWEVGEGNPSNFEAGARSLFEFGRNVGANAGRLADDIASGWEAQSNSSRQDSSRQDRESRDRPDYDADYNADYGPSYAPDYGPERQTDSYAEDGYAEDSYDSLDRGWESFDDYSDSPPDISAQKRTYGDSLYGADSTSFDSASFNNQAAYPEESYSEEADSDDVYEAEYRVIEPPSKPLPPRPLPSDPSDDLADEPNR